MVLRLRIRICYRGRCIETLGIANSGFAGTEPEILIPEDLARQLLGERPAVVLIDRLLADGTRVSLARTIETLDLYVVTEDRVEGPIQVYAYISRAPFTLLNDYALSLLKISIIDPRDGIWCFRDELGKKERRSA